MKWLFALAALILAGVAVSPAIAGYEGASGDFYYDGGGAWNITNTSVGGDYGFMSPYLTSMYFRSIVSIPAPGAFKVFLNTGQTDWVTTVSNNTQTQAWLNYGGTNFSTGDLVLQRNSVTGDTWLSYFPSTWNPSGIPDRSHVTLIWNTSQFNIKWERGVACTDSYFDNNMIAFAYSHVGGTTFCIGPSIPSHIGGYFQLDYYDRFYLHYETQYQTDAYSNLILTKQLDETNYNSLVTVNRSALEPWMPDTTIYSSWSFGPTVTVLGIMHGIKHKIGVVDTKGREYEEEFYANYTGAAPTNATVGDLTVYTWDGSRGALLNNVLVTQRSITWPGVPTYNEYGYTGAAGTFGAISFWAKMNHEYNLTAEYVGYSTAYTNVTVSSLPTIVHLYLFKSVGYNAAEFFLTDEEGVNPSGVPIQLSNETSSFGKLTVNGFARFPVASGANYDYVVASGMSRCSDCYKPASGNFTASVGVTRMYINLTKWGDEGTDEGGGTEETSPHAAAESVMEMIYSMLPSLLMIVFLMLFVGVMDQRRRR